MVMLGLGLLLVGAPSVAVSPVGLMAAASREAKAGKRRTKTREDDRLRGWGHSRNDEVRGRGREGRRDTCRDRRDLWSIAGDSGEWHVYWRDGVDMATVSASEPEWACRSVMDGSYIYA
jgi:hypothetical protein